MNKKTWFCNQFDFVLDASNQYQQTLSTKGIGNNSSNSDMRKQRVAMKKDLQRKLDHWDKDTDKSRYSISTDILTRLFIKMSNQISSNNYICDYILGITGLSSSTQLAGFAIIGRWWFQLLFFTTSGWSFSDLALPRLNQAIFIIGFV